MLAKVQAGLAAALGAIAAALVVYAWMSLIVVPAARDNERSLVEAAAKDAVFEQLKERGLTNETVGKMSPSDLCAAIGGVLVDGECQ